MPKIKKNKCIVCGAPICRVSTRCKKCANSQEQNPNWLGGLDKEKYVKFDRDIRARVRYRDHFTCQICGTKEVGLGKNKTDRLEVHHIDYNKEHTVPENLVSLCKSCHIKTNFNREYYKKFFSELLQKRGIIKEPYGE